MEVKTETLAIKAAPLSNGYVKAKTGDDTADAVYQNWYSAVYLPSEEAPDPGPDPEEDNADLASLTIGMVNDMYAESRNDDYNYATAATQSDYDAF